MRLSTLVGAAVALYLGSLLSGGYILLLHGLLVTLSSEPYAALALMAGLVAASSVSVLGVARKAFADLYPRCWLGGLAAGFITASALLLTISSLANYALLLVYLVLGFILSPALPAVKGLRGGARRLAAYWTVLGVLALALLLVKLYQPVASSTLVAEVGLCEPIDVNGLYRFTPLMTAYVYAVDRIQLPTHTIYPQDSYIYYMGGHSVYNWIIEPEGIWNQLTREPAGVVLVYGDSYPPNVTIVERRLAWLHNIRFNGLYFDSLLLRIIAASGFALRPILEDNMEVLKNGRVYILVPLVGWERGLLASIPVLRGYAVVDEDGSIRVIDPSVVAREFPWVPLLPEVVAREWVEVLRYKPGFIEVYLYHNTFVVRDVGTNPQPYLTLDDEGRQWWVFVAEPPGETYSAKYVLYVAAGDLEPRVLVYRLPRPVIGVSKVASYVKQAHPAFDWDQFRVEEPIPAVINGRLYWKVTVVTRDYRGLVAVDLVDAETGQVYSLQPKRHASYLDVMSLLIEEKPVGPEESLYKRIEELEEKLKAIREELDRVLEELEAIKSLIAAGNETVAR